MGFAILSGAGLVHGKAETKYDGSATSDRAEDDTTLATSIIAAVDGWYKGTGTDALTITNDPITTGTITDMLAAGSLTARVGDTNTRTFEVSGTIATVPVTNVQFLYTLSIKVEENDKYTWSVSRTMVDGMSEIVHVHKTIAQSVSNTGTIDLSTGLVTGETICETAPLFVMLTEDDGSLTGEVISDTDFTVNGQAINVTSSAYYNKKVLVDFYVLRKSAEVYELQINAEDFAGSYYVEAETLFRRQDTGADLPAIFTLPNVKIQSNWTFSMSADGDPSTFTFTMDAMPDYTYFDNTKKMLCVIQIVDDNSQTTKDYYTVMRHSDTI